MSFQGVNSGYLLISRAFKQVSQELASKRLYTMMIALYSQEEGFYILAQTRNQQYVRIMHAIDPSKATEGAYDMHAYATLLWHSNSSSSQFSAGITDESIFAHIPCKWKPQLHQIPYTFPPAPIVDRESQPTKSSVKYCYHFAQTGTCTRGNLVPWCNYYISLFKCTYPHLSMEEVHRQERIPQKRKNPHKARNKPKRKKARTDSKPVLSTDRTSTEYTDIL